MDVNLDTDIQMLASEQHSKAHFLDSRLAQGWIALHRSLRGGVPHAFDIVRQLRSHGYSFPWSPDFSLEHAELPCYRLVHDAWREKLLPDLLCLLRAWERPEGLADHARRPEFQFAILDFRRSTRQVEVTRLANYFRQMNDSMFRLSELTNVLTSSEINCHLNAIRLNSGTPGMCQT